MKSIDIPQETKLTKRVFAMAGSSFFKNVRKAFGTLAIIIPVLALSGCGEGDGPISIPNTAADPLPPGFVAPAPTLGVLSETNADQIVIIQDIQQAGNTVVISTEFVRVFEGERSLGLSYTSGGQGFGGATILFEDADISAYNTLKFAIDTSTFADFANLTVQLEPPGGGTAGAFVALSDYMPVATAGGWETYEIPLADLPSVNLTLVNKLGFFNARDGSDALLAGTLYLDDIHFTVTDFGSSGGAAGTPIDPEVVLYATEGELDLVIPDDYDEVTGLESGSVPNLNYADDDTYGKVLSVFSGIINDTNVAQVGFIGFDPGFVTFYEDLVFKIKGMPNFVVFVTLSEDGDPVRINLSSSGYSQALGNDWFQVSIPLSSFTGLTTATGIVFESDDTASMQFTMFLTDIGFSGTADVGGDGGDGGDCDNGGDPDPDAVVFDDDFGAGVSFAPFGGSINDVTVDSTEAYSGTAALKVVVPSAEYTGGAMVVDPGRDVSAYDTMTFWAKASDARTLNVAGIGNDGVDTTNATEITNLALTTDWQQFTITIPNPAALTANTGLFHFAEGSDEGVYTIWFDEITYSSSSGGGGDCPDDGGNGGGPTDPDAIAFDDDYGAGVSFAPFGGAINDVTVDSTESYSGTASLKVVVPSAEYTGGALVADPARDVSAYDTLTFWAKASDARTLNVAGIGNDGVDTTNATEITNLALTTDWQQFTITIPDPSALTANSGLFHFAEGSDEGVYTIWFDEIIYASSSGDNGGSNGGGGDIEGNLAINGGFETGAFNDGSENASWQQFPGGNSTQAIVTDNPHSGTYAANLNIPVRGVGDPGVDNLIKNANLQAGNLTPNASVTVTFWMRGALEGAGGVIFAELFSELDGGGTSKAEILGGAALSPDAAWTEYSYTTTLGPDVAGGVTLQLKVGCGGVAGCGADVYFDDVSIVLN